MAIALSTAAGVTALVSALCGLGWRWLGGLSDPGVVVSWLDPASAVGLTLSHLVGLLGGGEHSGAFVGGARAAGLVLAAVITVGLIANSRRIGDLGALGWSLLAFVVFGPVIWPWYETWGFVFLAVVAEAWTLRIVLAFSALACFADVPAARFFGTNDPLLAAACWSCLVGVVCVYTARRLLPSLARGPALPQRFPFLRPGAR
jgi:alpha-1,6-mannosyltransferase